MWACSFGLPCSNVMFFTCGLLTCFEIVVYRKTAAFTVRGLGPWGQGSRSCGWQSGSGPVRGARLTPSWGWVGRIVGMGVGWDRGAWIGGACGRAGLETSSYGLAGAGADGRRGWSGPLGRVVSQEQVGALGYMSTLECYICKLTS